MLGQRQANYCDSYYGCLVLALSFESSSDTSGTSPEPDPNSSNFHSNSTKRYLTLDGFNICLAQINYISFIQSCLGNHLPLIRDFIIGGALLR
ncbi:hypothetical protein AVEN_215623-1 [Araneus ventricosus]|uniref:Uncharacterized protein n=1 Tax=Araneus ventricosus TaxID=182803 RepID=A0A4Y2NDM2_ARAVE|nr:hypothetical protein AVEN_215623-1 [Araneus ventricosus]